MNGANEAFGQRVRAALAVARVTRSEMADACNVTRQAVQRWCDGTSMPSSSHLLTLTQMTGASIEWLMWPGPVDLQSTDWAINGQHIKNIVRATLGELRDELRAGE